MTKPWHRSIALILAVVCAAACASTPIPTAPPTAVPLTATMIAATPTSPPPTVAPPTAPAYTATLAPSATPTSPPPTAAPSTETFAERTETMQIRLQLESTVITATLSDSPTARDFISLLPLTLTLEDYVGTEKIGYLPKRLSTGGAPAGIDPAVGDITYYVPWGNLAIFYREGRYANGLVLLGKIDGGIEVLSVPGSLEVTIERAGEP